ncbi:MAG TPA: YetF domain-containing protein [Oxalicibacterium sp.]|uniref:DUF421 domain-containing protein n=1 Tax=Oxalicibacterium sp. TaxID=2766525 RepID=UPI0011836A17|nr:DUF421 domain-containing protein [Oxalicibacterium sp.]HWU96981.1 YetF domain-containing protein [Oxalicibacterium sp.]
MLDLDMPWWEFIVRGAIVYLVLLVIVRLSGKRTVGQFTPFDLLVVMLLSEGVSNSLTGGDESLVGGLLVAVTLVSLNLGVAWMTAHSRKAADLVDGTPTLVGRDGRIFEDTLKKLRVGVADVEQALRESDCELAEMKCAILESDGTISIMKK